MVSLQLIFKENDKMFSKIVISFYISDKSKSSNKCAKKLNSQVVREWLFDNDIPLIMTYHLTLIRKAKVKMSYNIYYC